MVWWKLSVAKRPHLDIHCPEDHTNEELLIAMATSIILASVKNPEKKTKLTKAMAKIYKTIGTAYLGDPEFQALTGGAVAGAGGTV